MRRFLLSLILAPLCVWGLPQRGGTVMVGGTEYSVDTIAHTKVGPGTTHTQLRLIGNVAMNVFYVTIDKTVPGVSIRTVSGTNKLAGNQQTSQMAKDHTKEGIHYFAGSNGDFYYTSGQASNKSSIVGTPVCASTVDSEVLRTSNSSYQFSVDVEGIARICRLNYQKGTVSNGETEVAFKAINNDAPNNGVSLYTSKFWGSANQGAYADNCSEVSAKLVEGESFTAGGIYRMEVTSEPDRTGDMTVPADGFVILGRGNAESFVASLKPGDIVTFNNVTLTPEGDAIKPTCVVSGNPKNIGNGENLNSEGERGDAKDRHPRTGIGVSADGSKIVMMVVDGRSGASAGCTTGELGDILLYTGCAEGLNLDGGGSSTMYTEALGVVNRCSDGKERSVCNGVFAVLEAPEDNTVAELCFYDFSPTLPHLGMYTPQVLAFNAAGLCIDTDFQDYTLSCDPELGEIVNDGKTLYLTGSGFHALTARFGDAEVSIPVTITDAAEANLTYPEVVIDNAHPYTIGLYSTISMRRVPLNPVALEWTSADAAVAQVNSDGVISGVGDGQTTVTGTIGNVVVDQIVNVENPPAAKAPLFAPEAVNDWTFTKVAIGNDVTLTPTESGVAIDYTVSSTRGTKLTVTTKAKTFGIPEKLRFTIKPNGATIKQVMLNLRANNNSALTPIAFNEIKSDEENELVVNIADHFDTSDMGIWPIELVSFALSIGDPGKTQSHVELPVFEAIYNEAEGVEDVLAEEDLTNIIIDGDRAILPRSASRIVLCDLQGRILSTGSGTSIALPSNAGVYILTADGVSTKITFPKL